MKKLVLVLTMGLVAAFVPSAGAGGWATVGLSSLPPSGLEAGQDWPVDVTVLQHGETPLTGVQPSITVRNLETGAIAGRFAAKPTGKPGVYRPSSASRPPEPGRTRSTTASPSTATPSCTRSSTSRSAPPARARPSRRCPSALSPLPCC